MPSCEAESQKLKLTLVVLQHCVLLLTTWLLQTVPSLRNRGHSLTSRFTRSRFLTWMPLWDSDPLLVNTPSLATVSEASPFATTSPFRSSERPVWPEPYLPCPTPSFCLLCTPRLTNRLGTPPGLPGSVLVGIPIARQNHMGRGGCMTWAGKGVTQRFPNHDGTLSSKAQASPQPG